MKSLQKNNAGFAIIPIIITMLIVGAAGFIGWYVYNRNSKPTKTTKITTETTPKVTSQAEDKSAIVTAIKAECVIAYNQDDNTKQYNITDKMITVEINSEPNSKAYQVVGNYARVNAFCNVPDVIKDELGSGKTYFLSKQTDGSWSVDQSGQQSTPESEQTLKDLGYPTFQ
jgi:cytoskeletal protein RodZ